MTPEVALAEGLGDRQRDLGLGQRRPWRGSPGRAAIISCSLADGEGPPLLGLGPGDPGVGLGLDGLEVGADVVADVDVGDVDREDLEGRAGVEPLLQHALGDRVGLLEHLLVRVGRADRVDDALADAGDDRLVGGPADQPVDVGPDGHLGLHLELDAVLGDAVDRLPALGRVGAVDDLGIDARLHGLEHVAAGQVDRGGPLVRQRDVGPVGGDQGADDVGHVAAGQVVGLQAPGRHAVLLGQARLDRP